MARDRVEDLAFMSDVRAAVLSGPRLSANILLLSIVSFFVGAGIWASVAELDEVTAGTGRVIPSSQLQVVQNLEGGILKSMNVREGEVVEEGQILATIDDTQASSRFREDHSKVIALEMAIVRLAAEAQGEAPAYSESQVSERPDLVASEMALYQARKSEYQASIQALRHQVTQKRQEIVELESKIEQLIGAQQLAREELNILKPLVEQGVSARIELIRLERQINDISGELNTTQKAIPRVQAGLNEVFGRIAERTANFKAEIAADLVQAQAEYAAITEAATSAEDRVLRTEIRSPVNGEVQQILINTIDGIVQPGQDLLHIVPLEDNLLVEAQIRPADIAFLFPGQEAQVKITAYDFSIYGGLTAILEQISADTNTNEDGESFYQIRVRTKRNFLLSKEGETLPIIPGMIAEVDILTGKKTVMDYLLKPILKGRQKAMRER